MYILGFDIGGTKCAAVTATVEDDEITLLEKRVLKTDLSIPPEQMILKLCDEADGILTSLPDAVGISCGGPLDSKKGIILGPPNLPGWDRVEIVKIIEDRYGAPTQLQNDANASAVAEWKFGAGRGCENMVFLTFGTGLGAGLILNGALFEGANGNAGEVGHIRLAKNGPVGYGKEGSFEGFCSGGGIAKLGYELTMKSLENGIIPSYYKQGMKPCDINAKILADAARRADATALEVFRISAEKLGEGLSVIIDLFNPERIVIGSIFTRCRDLLYDGAAQVIKREALSISSEACQILPAQLNENIGDYASIATAFVKRKD